MDVIKISGGLVDDEDTLNDIQANAPCIVVHGGGKQLDQALASQGEPKRIRGQRVTSEKAARMIAWTLDGVGWQLARRLRDRGLNVAHVDSKDACIEAEPMAPELGRVGKVQRVDAARVRRDADVIVVTPVGWDQDGPLNVNADVAAAAVAVAMETPRLHLASGIPGVRGADGKAALSLDVPTCVQWIADGVAIDGMVPKLESAMQAVEAGVGAVHIGPIGAGTVIA